MQRPEPNEILDGALLYEVTTSDNEKLAVYIFSGDGNSEIYGEIFPEATDLAYYNEDLDSLCLTRVKGVDVKELITLQDVDPFESVLVMYWDDWENYMNGELDLEEAADVWYNKVRATN